MSDLYAEAEQRVAHRLRVAYSLERQRYNGRLQLDPAPYHAPRPFAAEHADTHIENIEEGATARSKEPELWLKLARKLLRAQIPPEAFIRHQFVNLSEDRVSRAMPTRGSLLGLEALRRYREAEVPLAERVRVALIVQRAKFDAEVRKTELLGLSREQAWLSVLRDCTLALSALFRFAVASGLAADARVKTPAAFAVVADESCDAAVLQYIFAPQAYARFWGGFLPKDFGVTAERLYAARYLAQSATNG